MTHHRRPILSRQIEWILAIYKAISTTVLESDTLILKNAAVEKAWENQSL